ncbi:unnamed protein product [Ectocarpus sp. 6 AP-2014]
MASPSPSSLAELASSPSPAEQAALADIFTLRRKSINKLLIFFSHWLSLVSEISSRSVYIWREILGRLSVVRTS